VETDRRPTFTRRSFLLRVVGAGSLGLAAPVLSACVPSKNSIDDGQWMFGEFLPGCTDPDFNESVLQPVRLPHCVVPLSWWRWDPASWDRQWVYRRRLPGPTASGQRTILQFDGVLLAASLYLNGNQIGSQLGGYLPFYYDITDNLRRGDNVLAVVVDSRWGLNVPPGRPKPWRSVSIDFYQPGGLVRPVSVHTSSRITVSNLYAVPVNVLSPLRTVQVTGSVEVVGHALPGSLPVTVRLTSDNRVIAESSIDVVVGSAGSSPFSIILRDLADVRLWSIDAPNLYTVTVSVSSGARVVHEESVRIGFREARFTREGFYLNGERVQLFGLNRHELYPYVGAAMPDRVHRRDAEIMKNQLNCTMVRCSHYPQSEAFLDACDELGLLVWEEAPGWDYIGNAQWRDQALRNVTNMVLRDRHHPSIIIWGTRLNETEDDVDLYSHTRAIAKQLDGTRAATGAVNSSIVTPGPAIPNQYRDPFVTTPLVQDVFALNDYVRPQPGSLPTLREPRTDLPYMVSEAIGTLVGPRYFRRTDSAQVQAEHGVLHAAVHDKAMSDPRYCGLLGWCAFDYPSGNHNSLNGLKTPGVVDIFREPKPGAGFYQAQVAPSTRIVLEPAFPWDATGEPPGHGAVIWSNCDRVQVFVGERKVAEPLPDRGRFPHLRYPPFLLDLTEKPVGDLRIDGWIGEVRVVSRLLSADRSKDRLRLRADDAELIADGVDSTRVAVRVVDQYGTGRWFGGGTVAFSLQGPAELVGDSPFNLDDSGGVAAVWVRTLRGQHGRILCTARHSRFATQTVSINVV
jgi:beta-galactosidase